MRELIAALAALAALSSPCAAQTDDRPEAPVKAPGGPPVSAALVSGVNPMGVPTVGLADNLGLSIGSDRVGFCDFCVQALNRKVLAGGFGAGDWNNPANFYMRRVNGTPKDPRPVGDGELVGVIWAQPLGTNGNFHSSRHWSPFYGRTGMIAFRTTEVPTGTARGGSISFLPTLNGTVVSHDAMWLTNTGRLVLAGEDYTLGRHDSQTMRDGPATLNLLAPLDGSPAISVRRYADPRLGFSLGLASGSGELDLQRDSPAGSVLVASVPADRTAISFKGPVGLAVFDAGRLPPVGPEGEQIYVRGGPSGPGIATSDGSRWHYVPLGPPL